MSDQTVTETIVSSSRCGFYGKVPSAGDFVSRELPRSFIDPWDRWLQEAIRASQGALGDDWLDLFLTSPIWRFALSPSLCGENAWCGVMIPSVDRVGRYFPFTLACQAPASTNLVKLFCDNNAWYGRAEDLALSSLDDGFDLESLRTSIAGLERPALLDTAEQPESTAPVEGFALRFPLPAAQDLDGHLPELCEHLLQQFLFTYSLWWTAGSEELEASLLLSQALPLADGYTAMLSGDWSGFGWQLGALRTTIENADHRGDVESAEIDDNGASDDPAPP